MSEDLPKVRNLAKIIIVYRTIFNVDKAFQKDYTLKIELRLPKPLPSNFICQKLTNSNYDFFATTLLNLLGFEPNSVSMCLLMFQVTFLDESTIAVLDDRVQTVRRRSGEKFLPQCRKKTSKFPAKIMVWGQYQFMELAGCAEKKP